jgi:hypothetical protein
MIHPGDVVICRNSNFVVKSVPLAGLHCVPINSLSQTVLLKERDVIKADPLPIVGPLHQPPSAAGIVSFTNSSEHFAVVVDDSDIQNVVSELKNPPAVKTDDRSLTQVLYDIRHSTSSAAVMAEKFKVFAHDSVYFDVGSAQYSPYFKKICGDVPKISGGILLDPPNASPLETLHRLVDDDTLVVSDSKEWTIKTQSPSVIPSKRVFKRVILDSPDGSVLASLQYKELVVYASGIVNEDAAASLIKLFRIPHFNGPGINTLMESLAVRGKVLPPYIQRVVAPPSQIEIDFNFRTDKEEIDVYTKIEDLIKKYKKAIEAAEEQEMPPPKRDFLLWTKYLPAPPCPPASTDDQCAICSSAMTEGVAQTACKHRFHWNCILTWIDINRKCPVCRDGAKLRDMFCVGGPTTPVLSGVGIARAKCDIAIGPTTIVSLTRNNYQSIFVSPGREEDGVRLANLSTRTSVKMGLSTVASSSLGESRRKKQRL